tara:strand:- start:228 stop:620 length:393 start_codon:yes stop_codon:yes gene_type:complete
MGRFSKEELLSKVGLPPPQTPEEILEVLERGIVLLKCSSKSGYQYVFPVGSKENPWQAKPYIRPGVQRSLGSFATAEEAATRVLLWMIGDIPDPPTPSKDRNKHGQGRKKRDRRKVPGASVLVCTLSFPL